MPSPTANPASGKPASPALPWHHHDMQSFTVCSEDGRAVALCNSSGFTDEENEEHAHFIIHACNVHDVLVEALKDAAYALGMAIGESIFTSVEVTEYLRATQRKADAAENASRADKDDNYNLYHTL